MNKLTIADLSKIYGFDASVISRWQQEGLDMSKSNDEIFDWCRENKINPIRKGDKNLKSMLVEEQIKLTAEKAEKERMENEVLKNNLIPADEVEDAFIELTSKIKNKLRTIPSRYSIKLMAQAEEPVVFKQLLSSYIDEVLEELGSDDEQQSKKNSKKGTKKHSTTEKD